jgi:hypothetical protein
LLIANQQVPIELRRSLLNAKVWLRGYPRLDIGFQESYFGVNREHRQDLKIACPNDVARLTVA